MHSYGKRAPVTAHRLFEGALELMLSIAAFGVQARNVLKR